MFKATVRFLLPLSLLVVIGVTSLSWLLALTGVANTLDLVPWGRADTNEQAMKVVAPDRAEDTEQGVTVRVVQGRFSSSETRLLLEVEGLPPALSLRDFSMDAKLDVSGVLGGADNRQSESAPPGPNGYPRSWLALGPVIDVMAPLILTISYEPLLPDAPMQPAEWRIAFTPGPSARDPVDVFTALNYTVNYGDVTILARGLHISSSQVSLYYDIKGPPGFVPTPVDAIAEIVYADGKEVLAAAAPEFLETLPDGSVLPQPTVPGSNAAYTVTFPVERPREAFTIRFGALLLATSGVKEYAIPVNGETTAQLGTDTFRVSAESSSEQIVVRVLRTSDTGLGSFLVASPDQAMLKDQIGNAYSFVRGETGFRKTADSGPVADRTVLEFKGPLDAGATVLYLAVPDAGQVVGPDETNGISVPAR